MVLCPLPNAHATIRLVLLQDGLFIHHAVHPVAVCFLWGFSISLLISSTCAFSQWHKAHMPSTAVVNHEAFPRRLLSLLDASIHVQISCYWHGYPHRPYPPLCLHLRIGTPANPPNLQPTFRANSTAPGTSSTQGCSHNRGPQLRQSHSPDSTLLLRPWA